MNNLLLTKNVSVVMAIIYQEGHYLMQLRDDIPRIIYPGVWAFFGGHIEPGETPEIALRRELLEEINYPVKQLTAFCCRQADSYMRHVFHCPLNCPVEALELREGWDLKLLSLDEIRRGVAYSDQAIAHKPLGDIHRDILLEFIASGAGE